MFQHILSIFHYNILLGRLITRRDPFLWGDLTLILNCLLILYLGLLSIWHIVQIDLINISLSTWGSFLIGLNSCRIHSYLSITPYLILGCISNLFHTRIDKYLLTSRIISAITHRIISSHLTSTILKRSMQLIVWCCTLALLLNLPVH